MRTVLMLLIGTVLTAAEPWSGSVPATSATWADVSLTLADGAVATVRVHHPSSGTGPWPVVIFSHGLAGSREGYAFLGSRWAAHGYVVIHPDHPGSDAASFRGLGSAALPAAWRAATMDPAVLQGRPALISHLIDALPELELALPVVAGQLDRKHIGVAGHSFGAWTTMCLAGMRLHGPGDTTYDWSDPRPVAFAALSPNGPAGRAQDRDWQGCIRPLLVMTDSADEQPGLLNRDGAAHGGAWRRQTYDLLPPGNKLLAWFEGARHCTYSAGAGARLTGEPMPDPPQVEAVAVITLAWWDAHLRPDHAAQAWLAAPTTPSSLGPWAAFSAK